jgi:hypothetical protein
MHAIRSETMRLSLGIFIHSLAPLSSEGGSYHGNNRRVIRVNRICEQGGVLDTTTVTRSMNELTSRGNPQADKHLENGLVVAPPLSNF